MYGNVFFQTAHFYYVVCKTHQLGDVIPDVTPGVTLTHRL